jgi:hypothetical protein
MEKAWENSGFSMRKHKKTLTINYIKTVGAENLRNIPRG